MSRYSNGPTSRGSIWRKPEVVEDRRLDVAVDAPVVAVGLGDANLAAVESRDDRFGVAHSAFSMIAAARSHSACVGTSANRA